MMERTNQLPPARFGHWLSIGLAAAVVAGSGLAVRGWLAEWTQRQLRSGQVRRIQSLDEQQAVRAIDELVTHDVDAVPALVLFLADERETVANAAGQSLHRLLDRWGRLRIEHSAPRSIALARALAAAAPQLSQERRRLAHGLATRLVVWPLDPESASRGQVAADCEAILRLPLAEEDVRVAAINVPVQSHTVEIGSPAPLAAELPSALPPAEEPPLQAAPQRVYGPVEPERLIDASEERPVRPKQFLPPRAMKIEG